MSLHCLMDIQVDICNKWLDIWCHSWCLLFSYIPQLICQDICWFYLQTIHRIWPPPLLPSYTKLSDFPSCIISSHNKFWTKVRSCYFPLKISDGSSIPFRVKSEVLTVVNKALYDVTTHYLYLHLIFFPSFSLLDTMAPLLFCHHSR